MYVKALSLWFEEAGRFFSPKSSILERKQIDMVTIDKIFHASVVLKDIIRPTPLAKAYGIS